MDVPKRKNLRLFGYDYSKAGGYFITICTNNRACILSQVYSGNEMERACVKLTALGNVVREVLTELPGKYGMKIACCTIMPNHIHMILMIETGEISVGSFVGAFKSVVANRWRKECDKQGTVMGKLWQRDFYDHIIRNEADYLEKLKYIDENPDKWAQDDLYME